jgi:hypothetical protein
MTKDKYIKSIRKKYKGGSNENNDQSINDFFSKLKIAGTNILEKTKKKLGGSDDNTIIDISNNLIEKTKQKYNESIENLEKERKTSNKNDNLIEKTQQKYNESIENLEKERKISNKNESIQNLEKQTKTEEKNEEKPEGESTEESTIMSALSALSPGLKKEENEELKLSPEEQDKEKKTRMVYYGSIGTMLAQIGGMIYWYFKS